MNPPLSADQLVAKLMSDGPCGNGGERLAAVGELARRYAPERLSDAIRLLHERDRTDDTHDMRLMRNRGEALYLVRDALSEILADQLGLMVAKKSFVNIGENNPKRDWAVGLFNVFDHPICFRFPGSPWRPAAVLVNNYDVTETQMIERLAETHLMVQPLNFPNLYFPGWSHQVLIVRRQNPLGAA